jgi:hypothetical protein
VIGPPTREHTPLTRRRAQMGSHRKRSAWRFFAMSKKMNPRKELQRDSPPLAGGAGGGGNCHLLRVNRYSTPIAAWQTTQSSSAVLKASGPREASG